MFLKGFREYFDRLALLSTRSLDRSAGELVLSEKQHTAQVIAHVAEISRRKAHLELGYKSLADYCVKHLGFSEGSAGQRVNVANVCHRYPEILESMARNELSLTVAGRLAPHLTPQNVGDLLAKARRKTRRQIEELLVSLKPRPIVSSGIRKRPQRPLDPNPDPVSDPASSRLVGKEAPKESPTRPRLGRIEAAQPEVYNFRFSAKKPFRDKLERLAEVLGVYDPNRNLGTLLEKAIDLALEKKDPQKKLER